MTKQRESPPIAILQSAIDHLYGTAGLAGSREEHENFDISLKLLALIRDAIREGWEPRSSIFDVACAYATGVCHRKYLYRRAERANFMQRELNQAIPDYDYSMDARPDRDPMDGRRIYGPRNLAGARAARDEKRARTRLCNSTAETSSRHDSIPTRGAHEHNALADIEVGDWAVTDNRHLASNRASAAGSAGRFDPGRAKPPKRVSSPAQARRLQLSRAAVREIYFGA